MHRWERLQRAYEGCRIKGRLEKMMCSITIGDIYEDCMGWPPGEADMLDSKMEEATVCTISEAKREIESPSQMAAILLSVSCSHTSTPSRSSSPLVLISSLKPASKPSSISWASSISDVSIGVNSLAGISFPHAENRQVCSSSLFSTRTPLIASLCLIFAVSMLSAVSKG
ncbi:hypothetical protein IEQ34_014384 [Dendrobium chrysotoxum]|uniref:Uncharacterized protein n=1 Tax=Dendrobium chrysotoxum TaxID=161865 RepID=A0AAV7GJQ8_DENCH|nr:hypothetical protein IEQ34_014384 [Dendrobium chrysotoxum]